MDLLMEEISTLKPTDAVGAPKINVLHENTEMQEAKAKRQKQQQAA